MSEQARILAIDPGPKESAWVVLDGTTVTAGMALNDALVIRLRDYWKADVLAVEMIASYGMAVGEEVFTTCVWIGRFVEAWAGPFKLVPRLEVKMCLCHDSRAKDANIRTALLDRFGGKSVALAKPRKCEVCKGRGTVAMRRGSRERMRCLSCDACGWVGADGPLVRVSGHAWAALAVALTVQDGRPG